MTNRYHPYRGRELLNSAIDHVVGRWNDADDVNKELEKLRADVDTYKTKFRNLELTRNATDTINVNITHAVEPTETEQTPGVVPQPTTVLSTSIEDYDRSGNEYRRLIGSLKYDDIVKSIYALRERMVYDRDALLERARTQFANPGFLEITSSHIQDALGNTQYKDWKMDTTIKIFSIAKHRIYAHMNREVRLIQQEPEPIDARLKFITTIYPSFWFKELIERGLQEDYNDVLYVEQKNLSLIDGANRSELAKAQSWAPDIHYLISRMCSSLCMVPFIPLTGNNMNHAVYTDTQLLIHYAAFSNPSLVNYKEMLKDEFAYVRDHKSALFRAFETTCIKFKKYKDKLAYKRQGTVVAPTAVNINGTPVEGARGPTPVPPEIMDNLLPFLIDNIIRYRAEQREEAARGSRSIMIERDSPIGRFINFNNKSARELESLVKKLTRDYAMSEREVSLKGLSGQELPVLDFTRTLFTQMMTAAMTCNLMANRYTFFDRVINLVDETTPPPRKDVLYTPSLAAFPGALFYTLMYDQRHPLTPGTSNSSASPYNIAEYATDPVRRNLYSWMKNFFRLVPGIKASKMNTKVYGLAGKYKPNPMPSCEGPGNPSDIKEMMKGLRFINLDTMIQFSNNNKQACNMVLADYLTKIQKTELIEDLSDFYGYMFDLTPPSQGVKLIKNDQFVLPDFNAGNFARFSSAPIAYYIETIKIEERETQRENYRSSYRSDEGFTSLFAGLLEQQQRPRVAAAAPPPPPQPPAAAVPTTQAST